MKYILEFDTLEELLIAQAKVKGTKVTETREYITEVDQFFINLHTAKPQDLPFCNVERYAMKCFLHEILKKEADIRKSMFL